MSMPNTQRMYAPTTFALRGVVPLRQAQLDAHDDPNDDLYWREHMQFRARMRAASLSREQMADVMAEQLRALGYDVGAWDSAEHLIRYNPQFDEHDLEYERDAGYVAGQGDGPDDDDAYDRGFAAGVQSVTGESP